MWCAKLYPHADYVGLEQVVLPTNYGTPTKDDDISSIKVRDGCTLKAYDLANKEELLGTFTSDIPKGYQIGNDKLSSFSCSCIGKLFKSLQGKERQKLIVKTSVSWTKNKMI